jgi:hypothetical protein
MYRILLLKRTKTFKIFLKLLNPGFENSFGLAILIAKA